MKKNIGTLCVQAGYQPGKGEPRQMPIVQSTTFKYETSLQMGKLFDLEDTGYFYTRLQNPTNDHVAARIAALEGGVGAMLTSSGQAANFYACFNICEAGDHMITTNSIYGGTYNLFGTTLRKLGIEVTFIDQNASEEEINAAFRPNTKLVFGETLSNPGVQVLDIEKFARIAHAHGVPLIVDNTFATPINCRPFEFGADIVTHSTTKYMDGHGVCVGGVIVDSGNFDWAAHAERFPGLTTPDESYHGLVYKEVFGQAAFAGRVRVDGLRNIGPAPSPFNSFLMLQGLETLSLRAERSCDNTLAVAEFLEKHPAVESVNYPGLKSNPYHELGCKYLQHGFGGVLTFRVKGGFEAAAALVTRLELILHVGSVGDAKSLIVHPASTTHSQLSPEEQVAAGVYPNMLRLSVGIENVDDLIADLAAAL